MSAPLQPPPALRAGDLIVIPTPSSPVQESQSGWEMMVEELQRRGYRVELAPNANARHGFVAGTPQQRGADLEWALGHPQARMVWCGRGGHGAAQVHAHVGWERLRSARPKIVQGFSDITCTHLMVQRELGWATFYGPNAIRFGSPEEGLTERTAEWCFRVLTDPGRPVGAYPELREDGGRVWRVAGSGTVEAPVVGGCLWLLARSLGTPWEFDARGRILLIEEVDDEPHMIDGHLTQLRLAGKLDDVAGILFAEPTDVAPSAWNPGGYDQTLFIDDVLRDRLGDLGVPVLKGFPVGHGRDLLTVPLGRLARLDVDNRSFEVLEPAVAA